MIDPKGWLERGAMAMSGWLAHFEMNPFFLEWIEFAPQIAWLRRRRPQ